MIVCPFKDTAPRQKPFFSFKITTMLTTATCIGRGLLLSCTIMLLLFFCVPIVGKTQPVLSLTPVISSGLSSPIQFVHAGDGSNRVFIVQQGGSIRVYDEAFNFLAVFLTVSNVNFSGEQGLLSLAFHPDYNNNGLLYVYYVNTGGDLELARYQISGNPNVADAASKVIVLTIPHPGNTNHNGGELHFGTDGFLYLSTGDGGGGGDVPNNAQNTAKLLGKMLRLNVNTSPTAPFYTIPAGNPYGNEIFDIGLRNPFRWSFDRQTQDIWIGDVGQDTFEELNFRAAGAAPGVNYGWRCYEAGNAFNTAGCGAISSYTFPVYNYPTQNPAAAITGGVVYRGTNYPSLNGYNISADFYSGTLYKTVSNGAGGWTTSTQLIGITGIVDFGETENGEVYIVSLTGNNVQRLTVTGALPVRLASFAGKTINNREVLLQWQTSQEYNTKQFNIEYSTDGAVFTTLGRIAAKNEALGASYSFLHSNAFNGTHFYRLKMIDTDGSGTYSVTISISMNSPVKNFIHPAVISGGTMQVAVGNSSFQSFELTSVNGILVFTRNISGQTGIITVHTGNLAPGIYMARLRSASKTIEQKIVIQ